MSSSVTCLFVYELKLLPRFHFLHPPLSPILIMLHFSPSRLCPPLSSSSLILPSFCPPPTLFINLPAPPRPTFAWHFRGCRSICGRRHQSSANCSCSACSPPPPSFHLFFSYHCVKVKKKPFCWVGWRKIEGGLFPQREACDWWSEAPLTASQALIGEEREALINMHEGAMKAHCSNEDWKGPHFWNSLGSWTITSRSHTQGVKGGGLFGYLCEYGDRVGPESNAEAPTKEETRMTESDWLSFNL